MTQIDPAMAQRVWQRVRGEAAQFPQSTSLQILMEEAWEDAQIYRMLSRRYRGKRAEMFARLYSQIVEQLGLLKGICALTRDCQPVFSPIKRPLEAEEILLRRGYGRAQQRLYWYTAHESDPQYGHLLPPLMRRTQEHSRLLLQLLAARRK